MSDQAPQPVQPQAQPPASGGVTGATGPTQQSLTAALAAYLIDKNVEIFAAYLKANPPHPPKKAEGDWTSDTAGGFPQPGTVQEIDAKWYEGKISDEEMAQIEAALDVAFAHKEAATPAAPAATGATGAPAEAPPAQG